MEKQTQEGLDSINKQLEQSRQQYGLISNQIEELMTKNQQSPVVGYQEQLSRLLSQRDAINSNMESLYSSKKTYELQVKNEKEAEHKNRIAQVEKLLGIHITPNAEFVYDNELQVPKSNSKDTVTLRNEQGEINKQLEQLFYDGKLDLKTYVSMKKEVMIEYNSMIEKNKKILDLQTKDDSFNKQKEQENNYSKTINDNSEDIEKGDDNELRMHVNSKEKKQDDKNLENDNSEKTGKVFDDEVIKAVDQYYEEKGIKDPFEEIEKMVKEYEEIQKIKENERVEQNRRTIM